MWEPQPFHWPLAKSLFSKARKFRSVVHLHAQICSTNVVICDHPNPLRTAKVIVVVLRQFWL